jgi:hypothetical protein
MQALYQDGEGMYQWGIVAGSKTCLIKGIRNAVSPQRKRGINTLACAAG